MHKAGRMPHCTPQTLCTPAVVQDGICKSGLLTTLCRSISAAAVAAVIVVCPLCWLPDFALVVLQSQGQSEWLLLHLLNSRSTVSLDLTKTDKIGALQPAALHPAR